jgi:hypothetical protein
MATSSTESVIKYRPYLSLAEIDALLFAIDSRDLTGGQVEADIKSATMALLKTKTLAELGLQSAAYKTSPRPTLVDKLGFGTDSISPPLKAVELPDFGALMNELSILQTPADGESQ